MPPGRPEAEPIPGEGGSSGFGPHQKLDLGGGELPAVPGRLHQEGEQPIQVGDGRGLDRDGDGIPCESLCKGSGGPAPAAGSRNSWRPAPAPRRPAAAPAAGQVELVSVGNGDTIRVKGRNGQPVTVRLACIDAPETAQGVFGAQATATLRQLVAAAPLELRPQTTDRYGRTVAEVIAGGQNVNLEMVPAGAAFVYRQYLRDCDGAAYEAAEQQAQQYRQGVWRWNQQPERPWNFRSRTRNR
jgi:micrococcal nuclease